MDAHSPVFPLFTIEDDPPPADPQLTATDLPTRGVGWVLRWAASLLTIFLALVRLVDFGCELSAEHALARAARAAALEATLPRATYQSVSQTVERRLERLASNSQDWKLFLTQNGAPVRANLRPQEGDQFAVVVTLSGRAALPAWLRPLAFFSDDQPIEASAERRVPGRQLTK